MLFKAKTLSAKNSALAAASGQAAFASKSSPTVKDGEPIKVKGVIAYNSNHWLFNFLNSLLEINLITVIRLLRLIIA